MVLVYMCKYMCHAPASPAPFRHRVQELREERLVHPCPGLHGPDEVKVLKLCAHVHVGVFFFACVHVRAHLLRMCMCGCASSHVCGAPPLYKQGSEQLRCDAPACTTSFIQPFAMCFRTLTRQVRVGDHRAGRELAQQHGRVDGVCQLVHPPLQLAIQEQGVRQ